MRLKILSILFLLSAFSATASAATSDATTASFIAEGVGFLSTYESYEYVPFFRKTLKDCIQPKMSRGQKNICMDQTLLQIKEAAKQKYFSKFLLHRIAKLSHDQHISHFAIPKDGPILGIVGDSISTGAVSDLKLEPRLGALVFYNGLWDFLFVGNTRTSMNIMERLQTDNFKHIGEQRAEPLLRIFDTPTQHKKGVSRSLENKGSAYADCEECSFGYLLGRKFNFPASNIFMAGQDGKDIDQLLTQLQRISLPLDRFPEIVLVSFTASLYCGADSGQQTAEEVYNKYYQLMTEQFKTAMKTISASPQKTQFIVISSADVTHHLTNESVLNHQIPYSESWNPLAHGQPLTCRSLRKNIPPMAKKINNMCKFVLNTDPDDKKRVAQIESFNKAEIRAQEQAVIDLQNWIQQEGLGSQFSISFVKEMSEISFNGEDVANECFHPSILGQEKIADKLLEPLRAILIRD